MDEEGGVPIERVRVVAPELAALLTRVVAIRGVLGGGAAAVDAKPLKRRDFQGHKSAVIARCRR
jgi:hypothetical protein